MSSPSGTVFSVWATTDAESQRRLLDRNVLEPFFSADVKAKIQEAKTMQREKARITPLIRKVDQVQEQPPDRALVITKEQSYHGSTNFNTYRYAMLLVGGEWKIDDVVRECYHCDGTGKEPYGDDKGSKCKECKGLGFKSVFAAEL